MTEHVPSSFPKTAQETVLTEVYSSSPPQPSQPHTPTTLAAPQLHVAIEADAAYKIGTCDHCVLQERGRPARAWDADGDRDLDFARDQYLALLAQFGLLLLERQAYVCP